MSLQLAAKHLASKGRGPDTELVHMTRGEIAGLQALAKFNNHCFHHKIVAASKAEKIEIDKMAGRDVAFYGLSQ